MFEQHIANRLGGLGGSSFLDFFLTAFEQSLHGIDLIACIEQKHDDRTTFLRRHQRHAKLALRNGKDLIERQPDLIFAQEWLSILHLHRKRYADAIATCRREIELCDAHSPRRLLGYLYEWLGRYPEAIAELEQSILLDPSDYEARAELAKVYRLAGQQEAATEQYALAREMALQDDEYGRACFAAVSGETEQALALLEVALTKGQLQPGWARIDPEFAFISAEPRFKMLIGNSGE